MDHAFTFEIELETDLFVYLLSIVRQIPAAAKFVDRDPVDNFQASEHFTPTQRRCDAMQFITIHTLFPSQPGH